MPRLSKIGAAALAAFGWTSGSAVSASYLVVAGGAGGGSNGAGGGGAGGFLTGTTTLNPTLSYTITVGAGGAGGVFGAYNGVNGSNSQFGALTAAVGGGGGGNLLTSASSGGSGGGGGSGYATSGTQGSGAAGTSGQGTAGGNGFNLGSSSPPSVGGGGGGGATSAGSTGTSGTGGAGGAGTASSITGSSVTYAGGGGGGGGTSIGAGGSGGGGAGGGGSTSSIAGTANTGGGGGGGGNPATNSAQGGSGIVIISYVGAQQFSGGVVTSSGGNTIHTFTTSGTLGPVTPLSANYLVVAGGASGGHRRGGGGGAGGLLTGSALVIDPNSTYVVVVGAGGAAQATDLARGNNGTNSSFSAYATVAVGGGAGGGDGGQNAGSNGGSGGGAGSTSSLFSGGTGTSGQGNNGGSNNSASPYAAGGGGGASAVGVTPTGSASGAGGAGTASSISGTSTYYAGGGGGSSTQSGATSGAGGVGGGGAGSVTWNVTSGTSGTANTGGGGGGTDQAGSSGAGGSGVVIISYAGSTQLMAGGVVTIAGGNVIHTFNSSGYLTPLTLLTRSLRFRSSATGYLSRTFGTPTNNIKWTWSAWVKRGALASGGAYALFQAGDSGASNFFIFRFGGSSDDQLYVTQAASGSYNLQASTTAVFRDPAAWYHIVLVYDSANATAADRTIVSVNGVRQTLSASVAQNTACYANAARQNNIGAAYYSSASSPFDGYMAEVNFIDGQALAPTAFGTVNSYGVWQPITYGGSYGTNGFRLPFTNNASTTTLGYDFSPQGNNWTTNNISVTAGSTYDSMTDVPTLTSATAANYPIVNLLAGCTNNTSTTYSNGNLQVDYNITSGRTWAPASIALPATGSFYFEFVQTAASQNPPYSMVGLLTTTLDRSNYDAPNNGGRLYNLQSGNKFSNGTQTAYGATVALNDVVGIAVDMSAGTLTFYKNNTSQGVAFTDITSSGLPWIFGFFGNAGSSGTVVFNFGQRPFAYTPPTGYLALNTFNL